MIRSTVLSLLGPMRGTGQVVLGCLLLIASHTADAQSIEEEIQRLLAEGYSADAIYNDQVAKGNAIYEIVGAASDIDPDREIEFRYLGESLLPHLPRSACGGNSYRPETEWRAIHPDELEDNTIAEVARLFFEDEVQIARLNNVDHHGLFPVTEMERLLKISHQWYDILPVRDHPLQDAVFISLYAETQEVTIDGNLGKVYEAIARGDKTLPVVFHYYLTDVLPIGKIESDNLAIEVIEIYAEDGIKVNQVPSWKDGDYHTLMSMDDVFDLFELPEKEDIDEDLWRRIELELRSDGFLFPVSIVLEAGKGDIELYHSRERIAVAKSLGEENIPVVFFYEPSHENNINSGCARLVRGDPELLNLVSIRRPSSLSGNPGGPSPNPPVPPPEMEPPPDMEPPPMEPPPSVSP